MYKRQVCTSGREREDPETLRSNEKDVYKRQFFFNGMFGANVSFGGTSLIIIVGVVLETIKKIESQMLVRNYTGFLNNKGSNASNSFLGY